VLWEQCPLHEGKNNVTGYQLKLLDLGRLVRRHREHVVSRAHVARLPSRKSYCRQADFASCLESLDNVGRTTRCRYADKDIVAFAESLYLARKNTVIPVVIAESGEDGGVDAEGDPGSWRPVIVLAPNKFGGEVLSVGCRATVAAEEDLAASSEASDHRFGGPGHHLLVGRGSQLVQSEPQLGHLPADELERAGLEPRWPGRFMSLRVVHMRNIQARGLDRVAL